jgi:hypothetical protein
VTSVEHGGLGKLPVNSWFPAAYAQDIWRVTSRVTVNGGVRWEPFFGQNVENGVISVFSMENFQRGIKSKVFLNAPAGLLYAGDEGFPKNGKTGLDVQWWTSAATAGSPYGRPIRWRMTSCRANTTTSTLTPRRSATALSLLILRAGSMIRTVAAIPIRL